MVAVLERSLQMTDSLVVQKGGSRSSEQEEQVLTLGLGDLEASGRGAESNTGAPISLQRLLAAVPRSSDVPFRSEPNDAEYQHWAAVP